ncbi:pyruvate, phosphate dikinase [Dactylosporangium sp. CA-139066]|uniref:pyruvate, phosphate dikinase n=1 Tax=Dactylosporangium sp. CA-139066 TaxID=3239930 RepID=UPI003D91A218
MTKYVYDFAEGSGKLNDLLGGKGGNLAEMARLGLPVPPGFTITTDACRAYLRTGREPYGLADEIGLHLERLERRAGRRLGDLLVSVRSGAKYSMPGMMETILNVGLTDATVAGLAARTGDERFAWDCYRRLVQMFGRTVRNIPAEAFEAAGDESPRELTMRYLRVFRERTGEQFPQDPREQLDQAVRAVFGSWNSERAVLYRRQERIPADLGTAVNVVAMVFGNLGADSGTGVAFTRDPATGERGVYGDYLANAQGEDVVAGIRNTMPLQDLEARDKHSYDELMSIMATLEEHYKDLCDIEFTIERGKLWMLQTRVGKRTAAAAFVIATHLVDEGVIDLDEALTRVNGAQLAQLMFPAFDLSHGARPIAAGVAASPGAAVGAAVFDARRAADADAPVILVRQETNPDDLPGMIAAQGILTSRGGKTSHAAVVARGMGKPCVCGASGLDVDLRTGRFTVDGHVVSEGDVISIDGTSGRVYLGEVPVQPSPVVRHFEGEPAPGSDPLIRAVDRLLTHADKRRRLAVRANADTAEDAARARRLGAQGIGLCRTEHMFLGERRVFVERLILARSAARRDAALADLLPLQRNDFVELFRAMAGLPVTIRLIDPPLHEFLPPLEELAVKVARAEERGENPGHDRELLDAVHRMHEENPMLGLRGVRLGLVVPGLFAMQVRAIAEAAAAVPGARAEIMVPLVGAVQELEAVRDEAQRLLDEIGVDARIGTMIEVPRAALTAGEIARAADFFSFGTNDLTQMGWGFSRDDVEGAFFTRYLDLGIFGVSPFESIDRDGVGRLIRIAVDEGRAARPDLHIGVCGEHGGDPASIRFFAEAGLDYVSCSPFRVPVARLEAGRSAVTAEGSDTR